MKNLTNFFLVLFMLFIGINLNAQVIPDRASSYFEQQVQMNIKALTGHDLYLHPEMDPLIKTTTIVLETDGFVVLEILYQDWANNEWRNDDKMIKTYDWNSILIEDLELDWDVDHWVNAAKMIYTNNVMGLPTETNIFMWDAVEEEWVEMAKILQSYDVLYRPEEMIYQMYYGGIWMNMIKYEYVYDATNLVALMAYQWDMVNNDWSLSGKMGYTWNGELLIQVLYENWDGSQWSNDQLHTFTYNTVPCCIEELHQLWDGGAWVNEFRETPSYDANWIEFQRLFETWYGAWENDELDLFTYDGNGNLIEVLVQLWESKGWVNFYLETLTYGTVGIEENDFIKKPDIKISSAPNPFNDFTLISIDLASKSNVQVYVFDLTGKQIYTTGLTDTLSFKWNGTDAKGKKLETGLYLLKVEAANNSAVSKLSIIR
ncbi:MAG: T9SS type A sorting domain-containing protein [Bacteroidales bacterium]|nr:T9SS type A sorting domain-containing protein [Bacteroidales bacterium]